MQLHKCREQLDADARRSEQHITELQKNLEELRVSNEDFKQSFSQLQQNYDDLYAEFSQSKTSSEDVEGQLAQSKARIAELCNSISQSQAENSELSSSLGQSQAKIKELVDALDQSDVRLNQSKQEDEQNILTMQQVGPKALKLVTKYWRCSDFYFYSLTTSVCLCRTFGWSVSERLTGRAEWFVWLRVAKNGRACWWSRLVHLTQSHFGSRSEVHTLTHPLIAL